MVCILVEEGGRETTMNFEPEEAEEIGHELRAPAGRDRARGTWEAVAWPSQRRPAGLGGARR